MAEPRRRRARALTLAFLVAAALTAACTAPPRGEPEARGAASVLRVGVSGDYAPFAATTASGDADGFDVALARRFAADRGLALETVRFAWPALASDLAAGRFDVAWSGVTVRPDRSLVGRFSVSTAESGALALVRDAARFPRVASLDAPGVRIAVNRGGHLERVARRTFPLAAILPEARNDDVPLRLAQGAADAAITDSSEGVRWRAQIPGARALGPFTRDRKAALVRPDAARLAEALDAWLLAREADGTLAALRAEWLGAGAARGGEVTALQGLLGAVDERTALMPWVALAKRRAGRPLVDAAQESRVLDAAVRETDEAAARAGVAAPDADAVRAVFTMLIAIATRVQERTLADPSLAPDGPAPELDGALRPAIARASDRIAFWLVRWDGAEAEPALRADVGDALRGVAAPEADACADALARYARSKRRASSPASTGNTIDTP